MKLGGTGPATLGTMERHGKRLDGTSLRRRVHNKEPLVHGSLDLRAAYDRHVAGARMNRGLKRPVLHALVQFPQRIEVNESSEQAMLDAAVAFINSSHGGDAVFAARLDRDEVGQHTVDVFYSPKYEKVTKARGAEAWISTSKHGKELCYKHREEIERRHGGRFLTGPRQVGIAMQSEFREFLRKHGIELDAKKEKDHTREDRFGPEVYKAQAERMKDLDRQVERVARKWLELTELEARVRESLQTLERHLPRQRLGEAHGLEVKSVVDDGKAALAEIGPSKDAGEVF